MGFLSFLFGLRPNSKPNPSTVQPSEIQPEADFVVQLSDTEVRCVRPDGQVECITWNDLQSVTILTTDKGPLVADVFWLLDTSTGSGCIIPQGATGERALLGRLQELPGFDNEALIESMSSAENRKFLCWQRANERRIAEIPEQ